MLWLHIAGGLAALITGTLSMFNRKGSKTHNVTGVIFFSGMCAVFVTSVYMSLVKSNWFLMVTGCFSFYMAASGFRSIFLKKLHLGQRPVFIDWLIGVGGLLFGLGMYGLAAWMLGNGNSFGIVPLVFGTINTVMAAGDMIKFYKRPSKKTHWIISHGVRMGGAYTASVTAFLVVNVHMQPSWVVWLLPTAIVPVFIRQQVQKYLKPGKMSGG